MIKSMGHGSQHSIDPHQAFLLFFINGFRSSLDQGGIKTGASRLNVLVSYYSSSLDVFGHGEKTGVVHPGLSGDPKTSGISPVNRAIGRKRWAGDTVSTHPSSVDLPWEQGLAFNEQVGYNTTGFRLVVIWSLITRPGLTSKPCNWIYQSLHSTFDMPETRSPCTW